MKKPSKSKKKILISVIAVVLVAAIGVGIWFQARGGSEPVGVYAFDFVGMTEYWGDSQESYGPVTTDRIQTVYLSDTQTVTEVKVAQGDTVKKGDILLSFDTTLSDLQLERKRLEGEKLKLQLQEAEETLKKIKNMDPMEIPVGGFEIEEEPDLGDVQLEDYKFLPFLTPLHNGLKEDNAFVCWVRDDAKIDINHLLREMHNTVGLPELCQHNLMVGDCEICTPPLCVHGEIKAECEICTPEICGCGNIKAFCPEHGTCKHGETIKNCPLCTPDICEHDGLLYLTEACPYCNPPQCIHGTNCDICYCQHGVPRTEICEECEAEEQEEDFQEEDGVETEDETVTADADSLSAFAQSPYSIHFLSNTEDGSDGEIPEEGTGSAGGYYVIFKTTQENAELGATVFWQGVHVLHHGNDFTLSFFTPIIEDYTIPEPEEEETEDTELPDFDFSIGYTAAQLAEMRKEEEKKIKELSFKLKMADAEYKIMQKELSDGNIYADIDGEVVSLLTEEEAKDMKQPMVKVSGGGGFYIEGSVSELEKDNLQLEQEVTINDWDTGSTYTGTVKSVGDFPSNDGSWMGMGNPNATYYPFTVFVDGEADLQAGMYANIQYSTSSSTNGIYLDKAFIRTEQGVSCVYVRGSDGRLEKRTVTTGKSLWGSYMEILSGLTPEDMIAFPYGKNVKEGAKTVESDISSLYMY